MQKLNLFFSLLQFQIFIIPNFICFLPCHVSRQEWCSHKFQGYAIRLKVQTNQKPKWKKKKTEAYTATTYTTGLCDVDVKSKRHTWNESSNNNNKTITWILYK